MLHTTIIHELRIKYNLTVSEYCILDAIQFLSTNPKSPISGWCSGSKSYIAEALGMSKTFVITTIDRLVDLDLIEKHIDGRLVRITELWFNDVGRHKTDGKQSYPIGKQSYPNRLTILPPTETMIDTLKETIIPHKGKSKKNIDDRQEDFRTSLIPFVETYGKVMVREFFDYWTERNDEGTKMKFEKEKAKRGMFEISKRLAMWKKNQEKFSVKKDNHQINSNVYIHRKEGTNNEAELLKVDEILEQQKKRNNQIA